jgi:large subunit ribosomal protein L17
VIKGRIQTTEAKAKELRPHIEKLLSRGRSASLADRRLLMAELRDARALGKLIKTAQNYTTRAGGYTRIVKLIKRKGDASPMAIIEFV